MTKKVKETKIELQTRGDDGWETGLLFSASVYGIIEAIEFSSIAQSNGFETRMMCNGIDCTEQCYIVSNDESPQQKMLELFEGIV